MASYSFVLTLCWLFYKPIKMTNICFILVSSTDIVFLYNERLANDKHDKKRKQVIFLRS